MEAGWVNGLDVRDYDCLRHAGGPGGVHVKHGVHVMDRLGDALRLPGAAALCALLVLVRGSLKGRLRRTVQSAAVFCAVKGKISPHRGAEVFLDVFQP